MKRNMIGRKQESWTEVPLNEDEKRSLIWMVDHNIDFKIENDPKCPQHDFKSQVSIYSKSEQTKLMKNVTSTYMSL